MVLIFCDHISNTNYVNLATKTKFQYRPKGPKFA
nr:MAG TPA_asm: hypothetical protein [Caudoviricetes sp.]